jgi:hypothetical protein
MRLFPEDTHSASRKIFVFSDKQCCGTGTANFCFSRTRTGFGPGTNTKCNTKVENKKLEANFLGDNAVSNIEKARFFTNFCC